MDRGNSRLGDKYWLCLLQVPTSVQDPEGKMMAKSEPLPDAQTAVGTDRFAHLVPAIVHKAALAYAAMRQVG